MSLIRESMEAYQARKALSAGMAWTMVSECPLLAWHESPFNPEYRPIHNIDFDVGTAAHLAILESIELDQRVQIITCDSYRTKEARLWRDEARAAGKIPLLEKDWELVHRIGHEIELQCDLFRGGHAEVTYIWEWNGVPCKARVDYLTDTLLIDLKTASSASPQAFLRAMIRDGHHLRTAWYLDGWLEQVEAHSVDYLYVVVGKHEPHIVSQYTIGERSIEWGRRLYRRALGQFKVCMQTGEWSKYPGGAVELPAHAEYALADMEAAGEL